MHVDFTPDELAQLAQIASTSGTDAEHLVKDVVLRLLQANTQFPAAGSPELPVWRLGVKGSLHRRDIYNDVR